MRPGAAAGTYEGRSDTEMDAEAAAERIQRFMRQQLVSYQRDGAVLGMSGGIDCAVVASLLVRALGRERVLALVMPERDSSPQSRVDALREIERLGIRHREIDVTPILSALGVYRLLPLRLLALRRVKEAAVRWQYRSLQTALGEPPFVRGLLGTRGLGRSQRFLDSGLAYARAKHRARMMVLYCVAEQENLLVVGTTNKTESLTGFVVKWGDSAVDIEPILALYKTQVRRLAAYLGVSQDIIHKAPSPDLLPGLVDETALSLGYEKLDLVLERLEQGWEPARVAAAAAVDVDEVRLVEQMVRRSLHTRQPPPHPLL
jgi:NAD+ synthase